MLESFSAKNFGIVKIGKLIKKTKKKYTWEFLIKNKEYILNLYHSLLSKKHILKLNDDILTNYKGADFGYNFEIEEINLKIEKSLNSKKFVLKIENKIFDYLIEDPLLMKNKVQKKGKKTTKKNNFYDYDEEEEEKKEIKNINDVKDDNSDIFFKYINYYPIQSKKDKISLIMSINNK